MWHLSTLWAKPRTYIPARTDAPDSMSLTQAWAARNAWSRGVRLDDGPVPVSAAVGTQEAGGRADPVQAGQGVRHAGVGYMAVGVDAEEVVAQVLAGGPRLDPAEVHSPRGELVKDLHQGTGAVFRKRNHHGGLVCSPWAPAVRRAGRPAQNA